MDSQDGQRLRIALVGMSAIVDAWKIYLTLRNIQGVEKMSAPPPELQMIPEGFDAIKSSIRLESSHTLLTTVVSFSIRTIKITTNYYPHIWGLSQQNGNSETTRAMWFYAWDEIMMRLLCLPAYIIMAIIVRVDPFLPVIGTVFKVGHTAPFAALYSFIRIKIYEQFGSSGMLKVFVVLNGVGLLCWVFYIRFQPQLQPSTYKKLTDEDIGRTVRSLALNVGYPPDKIFIDERSLLPNAYYSNAILAESITINRALAVFMEVPQVVAIVAHELGHWKYGHSYYGYCEQLLERTAACCLWSVAYGNGRLPKIFGMDDDVHPVVSELLAYRFIWVPFAEIFHGLCRLLNSQLELTADDYSCQIWSPTKLREALLRTTIMHKPSNLYDSWYSAWFLGYPRVIQRIRRTETHNRPH